MNYEELVEDYGIEYIMQPENSEHFLLPMGEFEYQEFEGRDLDPMDIWNMATTAYGYTTGQPNSKKTEWTLSDDYYFYDGYGHLCSIAESQIIDFFSYYVDYGNFVNWCVEQGYIESSEEVD